MKRMHAFSLVLFLFVLSAARTGYAHCEIPCGIYGDQIRVDLMQEHVATIEKSIKQIAELSKESDKNYNQIVRWVTNKEKHAEELQLIVYQYFMTQRIKPATAEDKTGYKDYTEKLTILHEILIYSMKSKQSTDLTNIDKLNSLIAQFAMLYFKKE